MNDDDDWVEVKAALLRPTLPIIHSVAELFYDHVQQTALDRLANSKSPIFVTDVDAQYLNDTFLRSLPAKHRPTFTCTTCRQFLGRVGHLALVDENGQLVPLLWNPADKAIDKKFRSAVKAMATRFEGKKVLQEFKVFRQMQEIGDDGGGVFPHFHLTFPDDRIKTEEFAALGAPQAAELAQMLLRVMQDYDIETVRQVSRILEQDELPYADNHKAAAKWLLTLLENDHIVGPSKGDGIAKHNLTYRYASSAFLGCLGQLRSGALSTLLNNIKEKKAWNIVETEWRQITNPSQYLRPSEAPKAGNITAAERLFETMGITREDMRRRYVTISDIPDQVFIWKASRKALAGPVADANTVEVFGNVVARRSSSKSSPSRDLPATAITFTNFVNKILPRAKKVEYKLASHQHLTFLITGFEGTKPLMQWHNASNLASPFVYLKPLHVSKHNLKPDTWNNVTSIVPLPHLWDGAPHTTTFPLPSSKESETLLKYYHARNGFLYIFCLEGGQDEKPGVGSLCLFPQYLKAEFHGVRATIEKFSNQGKIQWDNGPTAESDGGYVCGVTVDRAQRKTDHLVRVTYEKGWSEVYELTLFE